MMSELSAMKLELSRERIRKRTRQEGEDRRAAQ